MIIISNISSQAVGDTKWLGRAENADLADFGQNKTGSKRNIVLKTNVAIGGNAFGIISRKIINAEKILLPD
jgi:hypothetical protein